MTDHLLTPKAQATKTLILDTGHALVSRKGYAGIGLQEVLKAAGVPKGSFYHYFDSKEAFGTALLDRYIASYAERLNRLLAEPGTGEVRLLRFLNAWIEDPEQPGKPGWAQGCLLVKLAAEVADMPGDMHRALTNGIDRLVGRIASLIAEGQADGTISTSSEPLALARVIFQMWLGSALLSKLSQTETPMRDALSATAALIACSGKPH